MALVCHLVPAPVWAFDLGGDVDFYPFPTYKNTRNEGDTFGGVLVFLVVNEDREIEHVIAPIVQYNEYSGASGGLLAFGYPRKGMEYKAVVSWSENIDREVRLSWSDSKFAGGKYDIGGKFEYSQDGEGRFFGLGPFSEEDGETNYAQREYRGEARFGLNLTEDLTVGVQERFRDVDIFHGLVTSIPFIQDEYPDLEGVKEGIILGNRLYLRFDTRDNSQTPTEGTYIAAYAEGVAGLGGDTPSEYERFEIDGRKLFPFGEDRRFVLVLRAKLNFITGPQPPFWDQTSLGGDSSLRAFGDDRWIDRHGWLVNIEQRIRIWRFEVFDYKLELEAAPFVDIGSVYADFGDIGGNVQVNPGVAIRLLSRPNVVGGMSAAWGEDGFLVVGGFSFPF